MKLHENAGWAVPQPEEAGGNENIWHFSISKGKGLNIFFKNLIQFLDNSPST